MGRKFQRGQGKVVAVAQGIDLGAAVADLVGITAYAVLHQDAFALQGAGIVQADPVATCGQAGMLRDLHDPGRPDLGRSVIVAVFGGDGEHP